ncbi:MAG: hypothetical protein WBW84_20020 [Acidobacteriaceae bacterium]
MFTPETNLFIAEGGTPPPGERTRHLNLLINRLAKMPLPPESLRYTEDAMPEQEVEVSPAETKQSQSRGLAVGLTSLFFILLQSACTAFMAISGFRLLLGVGALAAATTGLNFLVALHGAALRIPMEIVAVGGSVVNLLAVRRIRTLRARPASQWRMKPPTRKQLRSESWQIGLAVLTLLLVAVEWGFHIYLHGTLI